MASDDDDPAALFRAAMKDARPLKGRGRRVERPLPGRVRPPASEKPRPAAPPPRAATARPSPPALDPAGATGLDRATADRLRRGRLIPDARLDLHGLTLAEAERALSRFLERAQATGCRVVLVITGKGQRAQEGRPAGGRIRAEFPHWLNRPSNRARIYGVRAAHARHGGGGAFYVMVKRPR
ncbi:Smr/MutS family protein [Vineibacter terrae]|uniref:Smr/MutS family protein n=1 Tax=Vineibacter terrae TaxID=2586908 RepID=UPI002E32E542|nr:Smr/MutS family protein [Vineibacter terrae]HEX2891827.1 Smr/MutS family protein [Vineibacter terrae]